MARYALRLFSIAFASFAAVASIVGDALTAFVTAVGRAAVKLYRPSARETLALDRLFAPVAVIPALRSRFTAFIERLRTHAEFNSGHFDPGRMAA
jgi:hypothetical protein